jgi:hypothetical protein
MFPILGALLLYVTSGNLLAPSAIINGLQNTQGSLVSAQ